MAYTTLQDLIDRFGEDELIDLTDRADPPTGAVDVDVVDKAISDADAQIDGYLKGKYRLPLSSTPDLVRGWSETITHWNLYRYDTPEKVQKAYDQVMSQLKDVARGLITLDVDGVEPETSGGSGVMITDRERPLDEDSLKGWI